MAYSLKDLENAAKNVNYQLEAHSRRQGKAIADQLLANTSQGRGLWFIVLWPAWMLIFASSSILFAAILVKMGFHYPFSLLGGVAGFFFARAWYQAEFTIRHPFWSAVLGYFGTVMGVLFLVDKFHLALA